eukprot:5596647-Pleurochrysis_carterae.AAC.4
MRWQQTSHACIANAHAFNKVACVHQRKLTPPPDTNANRHTCTIPYIQLHTRPSRKHSRRTHPRRTHPRRTHPRRTHPRRTHPRRTHPRRTQTTTPSLERRKQAGPRPTFSDENIAVSFSEGYAQPAGYLRHLRLALALFPQLALQAGRLLLLLQRPTRRAR